MTDKELRKLNRAELLELLLEQSRRNEELEAELSEVKAKLESKTIAIEKAGSIAEASVNLTNVFAEAQKAADLYLANVKRIAGVEEIPEAVRENAAKETAPAADAAAETPAAEEHSAAEAADEAADESTDEEKAAEE